MIDDMTSEQFWQLYTAYAGLWLLFLLPFVLYILTCGGRGGTITFKRDPKLAKFIRHCQMEGVDYMDAMDRAYSTRKHPITVSWDELYETAKKMKEEKNGRTLRS